MSKTFALDGFEPIKRIGGGGFGDVWLTRQTNVDRQVAVKVGHAPIQDDIIRVRFERECKALGRLSGHPNIVDVFTAGSLSDGRPYLVLEYVDGGTLWQRLKRSPLTEAELLAVGEQLAGALAEAHSSGVLHRDLKPENILMRSNGDVVLGDFGIARLQDGVNTTSAAITASVAYAAPEVLGGTKASAASDLYGIGVCLLAAILRSVPFVDRGDKSIHPIISRVMTDEPPDLRSHGVSEDVAKLVESLLHKDPSRRPDSATEVQNRFQALQTQPWQGDRRLVAQSYAGRPPAPVRPSARRSSTASSTGLATESTANDETTIDSWPTPQQGPDAVPVSTATSRSRTAPTFGLPADEPGHVSLQPRNGRAGSLADDIGDDDTSGSIRAFAIAYVATLAAGALIIYLLAQLLS